MSKGDFNIELHESEGEEIPYVQETVFQKKPANLETKKREPIFDFVKEKEKEANLKAAAEKYVAETSGNAMKAAASMMADSALKAVQIPTVEVHLSDINARDEFRKHSYVSMYAEKMICGKGFDGYKEALEYLAEKLK